MGWFKKKDRVIDLTEHYRKQQEKAAEAQVDSQDSSTTGALGFLGNIAGAGSTTTSEASSDTVGLSGSDDERKRKLAKRLMDMTEKLEDLSNQIYHLQQRIEVLERKSGVGGY